MRRFLYKQWSITVVDKEYYIESITGEKELLHFDTDLECMAYLDRRTHEANKRANNTI
jgi:hypothetical protein